MINIERPSDMATLLEVEHLSIDFDSDQGILRAVDDISFAIETGETVGLVGESGCGKSVTALSIMRLLPNPMGHIGEGSICFNGQQLRDLEYSEIEKIRGAEISMIFQEPMTALNPVQTIGRQISEALLLHYELTEQEALQRSLEILSKTGIPSPQVRLREYPHQLSGGMRQRVLIAIALSCDPALLIADEPTTALDVTIQAQILDLISDFQKSMKMSVLLITHDMGIIANTCDRVLVMYAGKIIESGSVFDIFDHPTHPYTRGLLESIPRLQTTPKTHMKTIEGLVPNLNEMPSGCRFQNRCEYAIADCSQSNPASERVEQQHWVSCFRWRELVQTAESNNNHD